jgi:hypothetical protein
LGAEAPTLLGAIYRLSAKCRNPRERVHFVNFAPVPRMFKRAVVSFDRP